VHLAYLVFIYPIQSLLSLAFGLYVSMTGNYGASLILLSLTVTGLTAPLYYLAERWKLAGGRGEGADGPRRLEHQEKLYRPEALLPYPERA
jgi:hypothetical protein